MKTLKNKLSGKILDKEQMRSINGGEGPACAYTCTETCTAAGYVCYYSGYDVAALCMEQCGGYSAFVSCSCY
jgi:hypothetical protein